MSAFYGEDLAFVHAEAFEALAVGAAEDLVKALPVRAGTVLDLGCGAGPLSARLREHGFDTWGLDVSPALIARARQRMPDATFHCGSVVDVDFPAAIGAAAIGEVLNYATLDSPGALLTVFRRVFDALERGGVFLFDLAAPGRVGAGRGFTESEGWAVGMIAAEDAGTLTRQITTFRKVGDETWSRSQEAHRLRLWGHAEVMDRLLACGFEVTNIAGYHGVAMPAGLDVYLARKP